MVILSFSLMVVAGLLAVYGLIQERKGAEWGRPLATGAAAVALILALVNLFGGGGGPDVEKIRNAQAKFQKVAGEKLASYLSNNYAGSEILVLTGVDYSELGEQYELGPVNNGSSWENHLEGFKEGLSDEVTLADVISLPIPQEMEEMLKQQATTEGEMEGPPPDFYMMDEMSGTTSESYNRALRPYMDKVDVIVVLGGLPYDVENLSLWNISNPPKLAVIGAGSLHKLKNAIEKKYIIGAITYRPKFDFEDRSVPKDLDEAFDKRFLLITPENIDQMAEEYENLFPDIN